MKTKQGMLKIIIEKAIKGGYKPMENWEDFDKHSQKNWIKNNSLLVVHRVYSKEWLLLLFNHKFAEAYFGGENLTIEYEESKRNIAFGGILFYPYDEGSVITYRASAYIYHLQQAVISEDVIKYYYENK